MARILVAVAWPYANGPLHLGHVAGSLLPPDIFARYQRMRGHEVAMVSGSDMHGTPITVAADKEGVPPEALAARFNTKHNEALAALGIHFDLFTSTATANHREVAQDVFVTLERQGYVYRRPMTAAFDPQAQRFLPDRYVEGTCPHCSFDGARGDQCDSCGRTLDPQELLSPRSKLTGATPVYRETEHFFLKLSAFEGRLKSWVAEQAPRAAWRPNTVNFTENWLKEGLKDRPITRDMTYGVPIPEAAGSFPDKRIYVWFEAVIGYLSATIEWAKAKRGDPRAWEPFWLDPATRSHYFLGKDNIPFHTIIWPAMILGYSDGKGLRYNLPWDVPANEFLQFAGAKFSKSRGNAFYVLDLLQSFTADQVRYYLAANMPERGDTDWTWPDFTAKVNDELVATLGNYVNRVLSLCQSNFGGAPDVDPSRFPLAAIQPGWEDAVRAIEGGNGEKGRLLAAAEALEACEFKEALRNVMQIARIGNQRLSDLAPWALVKQGEEGKARAGLALLWHLGLVKTLSLALQPFLPAASEAIWRQLGEPGEGPRALAERSRPGEDAWPAQILEVSPGQKLGDVKPLVPKLDLKAVLAEYSPEKPEETAKPQPAAAPKPAAAAADAPKPVVSIDDFAKLDLRVGLVKSVENHPKADKLYVLKVDVGGEERTICAGLRQHVKPEELLGKRVIVIANLAPRELRGVPSQGMLLAAEHGDVVAPLHPAKELPPGSRIR